MDSKSCSNCKFKGDGIPCINIEVLKVIATIVSTSGYAKKNRDDMMREFEQQGCSEWEVTNEESKSLVSYADYAEELKRIDKEYFIKRNELKKHLLA